MVKPFLIKMDAQPRNQNPVHFEVDESDSDEVDMAGLLDDVNGPQEHTADDSDADSEFGSKSKEIEFCGATVSGINECLTYKASRLCIFDLALKLNNSDHYDIGGTYLKQNSQLKPQLWFYCTTSVCPQNNYILNIFVCCRKMRSVSIGISDTNAITKKRIFGDDAVAKYLTLPETLSWKTLQLTEMDESQHLASYCFSREDLKLLNRQTLCIPIRIVVNTLCVISKEKVQSIKKRHSLLNLFKRGENTDYTLESKSGIKYDVHKVLLAARSSVLRDLIKNSKTDMLIVSIDDNGMEQFLEYIYTGSVKNFLESNWCQLIELAERFKLDNLFKELEYAIAQQISITNAVDIAVLSEKYKLDMIQKKVFEYIRNHQEVLETDGWKNLNDVALTKKMFKEIYQADTS